MKEVEKNAGVHVHDAHGMIDHLPNVTEREAGQGLKTAKVQKSTELVAELSVGDVVLWDGQRLTVSSFDRDPRQCIVTYSAPGRFCGFVAPPKSLFQRVVS